MLSTFSIKDFNILILVVLNSHSDNSKISATSEFSSGACFISSDTSKVIFLEGRLLSWKQVSGVISKVSPSSPPPHPHQPIPDRSRLVCHPQSGKGIELLVVKPSMGGSPSNKLPGSFLSCNNLYGMCYKLLPVLLNSN